MPSPYAHSYPDIDVVVAGHGPVAQVLGILLAQRGWLVTVIDPRARQNPFPRVVGLDSETVRILASAGIGQRLNEIGVPGINFEIDNAPDQALLRFSPSRRRPGITMFHQPALEAALADRGTRLPNLQVLRGHDASLLVDHGKHAEVLAGDEAITAYWVVGCDGATSFHTRRVDRWRNGRILLAGDAAHLMPLLAGQGLCGGIRDAANLAWKLDLVLRGRADESLLDSYVVERLTPRRLSAGVLHSTAGGAFTHTGQLLPQGRVASVDQRGVFDEVVGNGFVLMSSDDPRMALNGERRAFLDGIGAHVVHLLPAGTPLDHATDDAVVDVDDVYLPYLAEAGEIGALVRPDFYLFGTAHDRRDLVDLVDDLRHQLFHATFRSRPIE